jgi:hypothetical protein
VVSLDGEPIAVTPLVAEVVAGACQVVVPARATRSGLGSGFWTPSRRSISSHHVSTG